MSKKQFWSRLSLYIIFGLILPFAFMVWRFHLFGKISTISVGGWGLVAIIFVSVFIIKLVKYIRRGLPFSILTQCLEAICKVTIPLLIAIFCVHYLKDLTTQVFQLLCVLLICETFAAIINPLPQWINENKINESDNHLKELLKSFGLVKGENK